METQPIASSARALRHMFLRDMVLSASIGVHPHEHAAPQRVRINVDLGVEDDGARPCRARGSGATSCRAWWITRRWPTRCAASSPPATSGWWRRWPSGSPRPAWPTARVHLARVRVEKLDIFADATSAGVEIERRQGDLSTR